MSNISKTINYLKKNGLRQTYYAVIERTQPEFHRKEKSEDYTYLPPVPDKLQRQREESKDGKIRFSIIVPVYNPDFKFFTAMVQSVISQSYPHFELILADAGENKDIPAYITALGDERINYHPISENKGISANTNAALDYATGDYVGLLDHDDLLTPDALYEMAAAISNAENHNTSLALLYSDEDKLSYDGYTFYDHHRKPKLNLDLILSNNYICHFLVIRSDLIKALKLRAEYDGAQDYDLVLRVINALLGYAKDNEEAKTNLKKAKEAVFHIDKVLYHWRNHPGSTAANPQSKTYAYEAGKRVVEDFLKHRGIEGDVRHLRHLGFYRVDYKPDILSARREIGLVGGKLLSRKNKITGGIYTEDGTALYLGLHKEYSGYMHRAALMQEADAIDIRAMKISPLVADIFEEVVRLPYLENEHNGRFNWVGALNEGIDFKKISLEFCKKVRAAGFAIVWDPQMIEKIK